MTDTRRPKIVATRTIERRTVLEWLGGATVLSLTSPLIKACATEATSGGVADSGSLDALAEALGTDAYSGERAGKDGASGDGESFEAGAETSPEAALETSPEETSPEATAETVGETSGESTLAGACEDGVQVHPGSLDTHEVFTGWGERTVDQQMLADLLNNWVLVIKGLVENPVQLGVCDLIEMGLQSQITDFHCVEGWSIYDVPWKGVPLSVLLDLVKPTALATHLKFVCQTGKYTESLSLDIAREPKSILAVGINDHTLPQKHGFPARVVVPRLLGYKNPKFVQTIEIVHYEHVGFWPKFGYTVAGLVPENRLRPGKY